MNANFESHSISRRSFLKASGVVGAASILAACGGSSSSTAASTSGAASGAAAPAADAITDYVSFETSKRELETWNFLYSQSASDLNVITNCWDGLLSFDCYGKAAPAIASSWEHNDDSTVWTFHLRDDVDWCDVNGEVKSHLTSKDFLVGLEWVLNALKNEAFNTSMPSETVVGAAEYYDLTKDKGDAAADMTYEWEPTSCSPCPWGLVCWRVACISIACLVPGDGVSSIWESVYVWWRLDIPCGAPLGLGRHMLFSCCGRLLLNREASPLGELRSMRLCSG